MLLGVLDSLFFEFIQLSKEACSGQTLFVNGYIGHTLSGKQVNLRRVCSHIQHKLFKTNSGYYSDDYLRYAIFTINIAIGSFIIILWPTLVIY
jgi:hypothetical protein